MVIGVLMLCIESSVCLVVLCVSVSVIGVFDLWWCWVLCSIWVIMFFSVYLLVCIVSGLLF